MPVIPSEDFLPRKSQDDPTEWSRRGYRRINESITRAGLDQEFGKMLLDQFGAKNLKELTLAAKDAIDRGEVLSGMIGRYRERNQIASNEE